MLHRMRVRCFTHPPTAAERQAAGAARGGAVQRAAHVQGDGRVHAAGGGAAPGGAHVPGGAEPAADGLYRQRGAGVPAQPVGQGGRPRGQDGHLHRAPRGGQAGLLLRQP
eukprot:6043371-Pyramimonas_sp.AAC.1